MLYELGREIKVGNKWKLCYVTEESMMTTKRNTSIKLIYSNVEPELLWGDDWDDRPYEHNAGLPYRCYKENGEYKEAEFMVLDLVCHNVKLPHDGHINSPFSVEDFNITKTEPWLKIGFVGLYAGSRPKDLLRLLLNERYWLYEDKEYEV